MYTQEQIVYIYIYVYIYICINMCVYLSTMWYLLGHLINTLYFQIISKLYLNYAFINIFDNFKCLSHLLWDGLAVQAVGACKLVCSCHSKNRTKHIVGKPNSECLSDDFFWGMKHLSTQQFMAAADHWKTPKTCRWNSLLQGLAYTC